MQYADCGSCDSLFLLSIIQWHASRGSVAWRASHAAESCIHHTAPGWPLQCMLLKSKAIRSCSRESFTGHPCPAVLVHGCHTVSQERRHYALVLAAPYTAVAQALAPAAPKPPPQIRPARLNPQQQLSLRCSAIQRILVNSNTPSQETRIALLSRLATTSLPSDGISDKILQHMLKAYHSNQGHELATTWLFALYKQHTGKSEGGSNPVEASKASPLQAGLSRNQAADAESAGASGVSGAEGSVATQKGQDGAAPLEVDLLEGMPSLLSCSVALPAHTQHAILPNGIQLQPCP